MTAGELSHQVLVLVTTGHPRPVSPDSAVLVRNDLGEVFHVAGVSSDGTHVIIDLTAHGDVTIVP